MRKINLSTVVLSHLNDVLVENGSGRTDLVSQRIQFIKHLLFHHSDKPLSEIEMDESELNKLWIKLYEE